VALTHNTRSLWAAGERADQQEQRYPLASWVREKVEVSLTLIGKPGPCEGRAPASHPAITLMRNPHPASRSKISAGVVPVIVGGPLAMFEDNEWLAPRERERPAAKNLQLRALSVDLHEGQLAGHLSARRQAARLAP
jgi:hypothetical protein